MGDVRQLSSAHSRHGPAAKPGGRGVLLWREAVGRQLRLERVVRGERLVDVAHRAAVSPQYLSEVERGRKDPSSEVLSALAGAVDVPVRELVLRAAAHLAVVPGGEAVRPSAPSDALLRAA
jgi:transcriptional regulator with XRE-family HTH domain